MDPVNGKSHVTLHAKRDFAEVIKVKDLEMECSLGLSEWAPSNLMSP